MNRHGKHAAPTLLLLAALGLGTGCLGSRSDDPAKMDTSGWAAQPLGATGLTVRTPAGAHVSPLENGALISLQPERRAGQQLSLQRGFSAPGPVAEQARQGLANGAVLLWSAHTRPDAGSGGGGEHQLSGAMQLHGGSWTVACSYRSDDARPADWGWCYAVLGTIANAPAL